MKAQARVESTNREKAIAFQKKNVTEKARNNPLYQQSQHSIIYLKSDLKYAEVMSIKGICIFC